jgi:hypothetical protein
MNVGAGALLSNTTGEFNTANGALTQGATIARLEQQVAALTAGLQKVSAHLEMSKTAPQTVNNP